MLEKFNEQEIRLKEINLKLNIEIDKIIKQISNFNIYYRYVKPHGDREKITKFIWNGKGCILISFQDYDNDKGKHKSETNPTDLMNNLISHKIEFLKIKTEFLENLLKMSDKSLSKAEEILSQVK